MGWNYMPPSGGGLIHPHQQYFATMQPGNTFRDEYGRAEEFRKRWGVDYWSALVEEEARRNERYIGRVGDCHFLASFVSLGFPGDITVILPGVYSIHDVTAQVIADLASGLTSVFAYFQDADVFSFNATWCFGPRGQDFFAAHLRIIPRIFLNATDSVSDCNFFQGLLGEPVSVVLPEDLCAAVRPYLRG
jgi:galactose-1-phosphate uridylyltransferase